MAFPIWKFEDKGDLNGKLTAKLSNLPPYGKKLYGIETADGLIWYIWGTYVLVGKLAPLNFNTKIKIRYLGLGREKPEDKFDKKLFDVEIVALPTETRKKKKKND